VQSDSPGPSNRPHNPAPRRPVRRREIGGPFSLDAIDLTAPFPTLGGADNARNPYTHEDDDVFPFGEEIQPVLPPFSWFAPGDGIPNIFDANDGRPRLFREPERLDETRTELSPTPPPNPPQAPRLRRGGLRAPEVIASEHIHALLAAERGD
jgi:hypothetical protein